MTTARNNPVLEAALQYLELGISVIPVTYKGKRPTIKWQPYQTTLPTETDLVNWFGTGNQNLALIMGEVSGNLCAVDFDDPMAYQQWHKDNPAYAHTATQKTGKGYHVFFRLAEQGNGKAYWHGQPVGDIRGAGGYVVVAPSVHQSGHQYQWLPGQTLWDVIYEIDSLSDIGIGTKPEQITPMIGNGSRPLMNAHPKHYGQAALRGELAKLLTTTNGNRNNQLNQSAFSLGQLIAAGVLNREEVEAQLSSTATQIGLGVREIRATIASGLEAGIRQPRTLSLQSVRPSPRTSPPKPEDIEQLISAAVLANGGAEKAAAIQKLVNTLARTDDITRSIYVSKAVEANLLGKRDLTNAVKSVRQLEQSVSLTPTDDEIRDQWIDGSPLTAYGLGEWRRYEQGIWDVVPELSIKGEIQGVIESAKSSGIKPTTQRLNSVTDLAQVKLFIPAEVWDSQTDFLVCKNGTLQISTGQLHSHDPEYYATSGVASDFDPRASAPNWEKFVAYLSEALKPDVASFLQEFFGYALTIDTRYEIAVWLVGPHGCGKSTFLEAVKHVMGQSCGKLGLAELERSRFALSRIPGKTLLISTEQPAIRLKSSDILNALISGETVTVERKFQDSFEYKPRAKLAWAMNRLPLIDSPEDGLWRRVKIIEFPELSEENRDPNLKERIKAEGSGVLNWMLAGLERLKYRGYFQIPASVRVATETARGRSDLPAKFVMEECLTHPGSGGRPLSVGSTELYQAYCRWCVENNFEPQSQKAMASQWVRLGFNPYASGGNWRYQGVALRDSEETVDDVDD